MNENETKLWIHCIGREASSSEQSVLIMRFLHGICVEEGIDIHGVDFDMPGLELIERFSSELKIMLSLSHTNGLLAVALSGGHVGVDCEAKGRSRNWGKIASSFFSKAESKTILGVDNERREETFLRHWVLKEAFVKAHRESIFGSLNSLILESKTAAKIDIGANDTGWHAWLYQEGQCHVALCTTGCDIPVACQVKQLPNTYGEGLSGLAEISQGQYIVLSSAPCLP